MLLRADNRSEMRALPGMRPILAIFVAVVAVAGVSSVLVAGLEAANPPHSREKAAAKAAVRSAIAAADAYYQDTSGGDYSYTGIDRARLDAEVPGIGSSVRAASSADGGAYCIEASADGGARWAWIVGSAGGSAAIRYGRHGCDPATFRNPR